MSCAACSVLEVTCNHNVTIGYLKQLVATMPSPITVVGDDNSYCPTYGELTGGTIIQRFSDGGSGSWSNNVDGITISGGYSNGQIVAKKDLKLIYTVLDGITVSNNSPVVTECGGSTTSTKTITFRKYVKECDSEPTSTTQEDTTISVTWSGTDSSSSGRKSYSRNESFSDEHASNVLCTVVWRGTSYTSNSITVKQNKRTTSSTQDTAKSSGQTLSVVCYPTSFNCEGGTSNASATYYYTTWTERAYIDTCGYEYDRQNINIQRDRTQDVSSSLNARSHTFDACVEGTFTFSASYGGFSDTAVASELCSGCECIETGITSSCSNITVDCYAHSSVSTLYTETIYYSNCDPSSNSYYVTVDVNIPCNSTTSQKTFTASYYGNTFTITQGAGNCCGPSCVCGDLTLNSASNGNSDAGKYTVATFSPYSDSCLTGFSASSSESWLSNFSISNGTITAYATENTEASSRSTTVTLSYTADGSACSKSVTFAQKGKTCEAYTCYYVSNATHSTVSSGTTSAYVTWSYTAYTQYQDCTTSTSTGTTGQTVYFDENNTCSNVTRSGTFYWNEHYSCNNRAAYCIVYWSIEQDGKGPDDPDCQECECGQLSMSTSPLTWGDCSDTDTIQINYTINKPDCISVGTPEITGSNASHFSCSVDTTNRIFSIWPRTSNTGSTDLTATAILNYTADGESCSKTISLTHNRGCLCGVLTIDKSSLIWTNCSDYGPSQSKTATVSISDDNCISNITTSITGSNASHFVGSYDANTKTITIYPNSSNTGSSNMNLAAFVIRYNAGCTSCRKQIGLNHNSGSTCQCTCDDFTLTGATNITSGSQSTAVIGTYTLPSCTGSITNYTSDVSWTSNLSCINGTVYGRVTENTSTSPRSGTLSLEWTGGGLTCNKTATFTQKGGTPPSTCELIVSNGEGSGTYLPCEGGTYSGWICNYEVITTTEGVTSKTAEGSATGEFEVTDNCNGVTRVLNIENHASSDLILSELIDYETGDDLLMTYSTCRLSGTFTQEGGETPPPTPTHITSCNDLRWNDENGHFTNISNSSYVYDGKKYAGATFSIHPTFNGNWVKCKNCQIVQFYADVKTPEYFPQGAPGCDTHYSWEHNWAVLCDGQYACGTTGGTSGDTEINSNGTSGWGKIVNVFASEYGGLQPVESQYANLSVSAYNNSFSADFTCSWSYGYPMDLLIPECQDISDVLQFDVIVYFEIYKDQSKEQYQYTDSDETITCSFGFNVEFFRRYE